MKYFLILLLLGSLGECYYFRSSQPDKWNGIIQLLKVPEPAAEAISPEQRRINDTTDRVFAKAAAVATNLQASIIAPKAVTSPPKVFVAPNPLPAHPDWTWNTADGKTYKNVVITKVEADCVTILDSDGGARIDIAELPVDVQQLLNYGPALAAIAEVQRSQESADSNKAMAEESDQAIAIKNKELAAEQPDTSSTPPSSPVSQSKAASSSTLTQSQREQIEAQIRSLQDDVAVMQRDQMKVTNSGGSETVHADGQQASEGAYRQKIQDDQALIQQLQAELR